MMIKILLHLMKMNTIEKINYDYNKDSFYFETHEKSVNKNNNKNFEATYFL